MTPSSIISLASACVSSGIIIVYVYFKYKEKRLLNARMFYSAEIHKLSEVTKQQGNSSVKHLQGFIAWINAALPTEVAATILTDPKILTLKDRANLSDKQFVESFEDAVSTLQRVVGHRAQETIDAINSEFLEAIKSLYKE